MFAAKKVRRRINRREKIRNEASREERITTLLIDSAFCICLPSARAYLDRIQPRVGEELDLRASTCRSLGRGLISDLRKSKVCALGQWAVGSSPPTEHRSKPVRQRTKHKKLSTKNEVQRTKY